jgi:hypothetical protein
VEARSEHWRFGYHSGGTIMNATWWEITSGVAFGQATLGWAIARSGDSLWVLATLTGAAPVAATIVQAVTLGLAGTSVTGTAASFTAGAAAFLGAERLSRRHQNRNQDRESRPGPRNQNQSGEPR